MSRVASGLLLSAYVINPSDTTWLGLNLPMTGECRNLSHHLLSQFADPSCLHIAVLSAAHVILYKRNLTVCCPTIKL